MKLLTVNVSGAPAVEQISKPKLTCHSLSLPDKSPRDIKYLMPASRRCLEREPRRLAGLM